MTIRAETPGFHQKTDLPSTPRRITPPLAADIVVVPYWQHVLERPPQTLPRQPRVQARDNGAGNRRAVSGVVCAGSGGLLDGKRAATHWEFWHQFQPLFPYVQLDINALYVDDGNIITSAGTAAALDCCLYIIRQRFGSVVCNQIARRMIVPPLPRRRAGAVHRPAGTQRYPRRTY